MIRLSILIPAIGDQQALDETVLSVLENRPADCELLLIHRPDYQDPYALADEVRFVLSPAGQSPVGMLNDGAQAARADLIHWLQPGCRATAGWIEPAVERLADRQVALLSPCVGDLHLPDRLLTLGVSYDRCGRRRVRGSGEPSSAPAAGAWPSGSGPSLVAGIARRSLIPRAAIWNAPLGVWADLDLALLVGRSASQSICWTDGLLLADRQIVGPWLWPNGPVRDAALVAEEFFWRHRADGRLLAHGWHLAARIGGSALRGNGLGELAGRWRGYRVARRSESPGGGLREAMVRVDPAHGLSRPAALGHSSPLSRLP